MVLWMDTFEYTEATGCRAIIVLLLLMGTALAALVPATAQLQEADIAVSTDDIQFSKENPSSGEIIWINVTVHNLGPSVATNIQVNFYLGNAPIPPSKTIATIQSGSTGEAAHQWLAPISGNYTIRVVIQGDQDDPDESNNEAERSIRVGPAVPTITVTAEIDPETIQSKAEFWVNGSAEVSGEPVNSGIVKAEVIGQGISNETTTSSDGTFYALVPGPVGQGTYEVKVTVTQGAMTGETMLDLTVLQPWLNITSMSINPSKPRAGDNVKVRVSVQNLGNGTANSVMVELNIDNQLAKEEDMGDFQNGQLKYFTYNWKAKKGNHDLQFVVDPEDKIEEIKETDNKAVLSVTVKEKKDDGVPSFEATFAFTAILWAVIIVRYVRGKKWS